MSCFTGKNGFHDEETAMFADDFRHQEEGGICHPVMLAKLEYGAGDNDVRHCAEVLIIDFHARTLPNNSDTPRKQKKPAVNPSPERLEKKRVNITTSHTFFIQQLRAEVKSVITHRHDRHEWIPVDLVDSFVEN